MFNESVVGRRRTTDYWYTIAHLVSLRLETFQPFTYMTLLLVITYEHIHDLTLSMPGKTFSRHLFPEKSFDISYRQFA